MSPSRHPHDPARSSNAAGSRPIHAKDLTPEESRWLDGALPAAHARRLENQITADPQRAEALAQDREAAALWRDDAQRVAADVASDPDVLADRVLALTAQGPSRKERSRRWARKLGLVGNEGGISDATVWRYAAAAVLLMGIGVGGSFLVRPDDATAVGAGSSPVEDAVWNGVAEAVRTQGLRRPTGSTGTGDDSNGASNDSQKKQDER